MNGSDKDTYRKQIASLKNGTARQMEIAHSLSTLPATTIIERMRDEERSTHDLDTK